jgi:TatD DNase family protein
MLVDSHCHIDFPEFSGDLEAVIERMREHGVSHALCVGVSLENFPRVLGVSERFDAVFASVGVHPDQVGGEEPAPERLCALAAHPRVVAIGETGLDYFRPGAGVEQQRSRFRAHIRAARSCGKPLIIHSRSAAADTISIMREEGAAQAGGVMHCFTESLQLAEQAMEMNFFISFSGIVTFKNTANLQAVASAIPRDRLLIETDAPYLAPVPMRGKRNEPSLVRYVAQRVAELRNTTIQTIEDSTSSNFFRLFKPA